MQDSNIPAYLKEYIEEAVKKEVTRRLEEFHKVHKVCLELTRASHSFGGNSPFTSPGKQELSGPLMKKDTNLEKKSETLTRDDSIYADVSPDSGNAKTECAVIVEVPETKKSQFSKNLSPKKTQEVPVISITEPEIVKKPNNSLSPEHAVSQSSKGRVLKKAERVVVDISGNINSPRSDDESVVPEEENSKGIPTQHFKEAPKKQKTNESSSIRKRIEEEEKKLQTQSTHITKSPAITKTLRNSTSKIDKRPAVKHSTQLEDKEKINKNLPPRTRTDINNKNGFKSEPHSLIDLSGSTSSSIDSGSNMFKRADTTTIDKPEPHFSEIADTPYETIWSFMEPEEVITYVTANKSSLQNFINLNIANANNDIKISESSMQTIEKTHGKAALSSKQDAFVPSAGALSSLDSISQDLVKEFIVENFSPDMDQVWALKLLFILLGEKKARDNIHDDEEFWGFVIEYCSKHQNFGNYLKENIKSLDFSDEAVGLLYKLIRGQKHKLSPNFFENICPVTGLLMFLIKEITEFLGIVEDKADPPQKFRILKVTKEYGEKKKEYFGGFGKRLKITNS